jgi:hypothetical protein
MSLRERVRHFAIGGGATLVCAGAVALGAMNTQSAVAAVAEGCVY